MQWIKRNVILVVGGAVALALLAFAGFYLFSKYQLQRGVTEELDAATQRLETLARRDPYPNQENIAAAKDEAQRVQSFVSDVEKNFLPAPYPQELDNRQFGTFLDNTRARLQAEAQRSGVEIPTNYWFTFAAQKGAMTFSAASLQPLASQLADIRTICGVLFDAKVNSLVWLKRVPVDSLDSAGSQDYLNAKAATNNWSVVMPYEVAFQGFSSELASVLEGFKQLPHCFVVTNIVVEPAATAGTPTDEQGGMQNYMNRYGVQPGAVQDPGALLRDRYGMGGGGRYGGGRYGPRMMPQMPVAPQPARAPSRGPATVLDEKPLRFTLSVQAVKLRSVPANSNL